MTGKQSNVLVTGSSGFLGEVVAARLAAAGHQVIGLDPAAPGAGAGHRHVGDDLTDMARLRALLAKERITHVIHAGGVSGPMVLSDQPAKVMAINVAGSLNLLQASLDAGVQTFVYCSSISAIGDYYESTPIPSDYPMQPTSPYGCSKAAMDMVLRGLWGRVKLDLCSLRFSSIYGPGRRTSSVADDIVAGALADRTVRVSAASDWPYIYIDDAAEAAIGACLSERRRELAYFVSYPQQVSIADLAKACGDAGFPVRLDHDETHPAAARGPVDIAPSARDFGFAPKVDHRAGIRRMIEARKS